MIEVSNKVAYTNPFPGLRSFEPEDAFLFFGREQAVRDLSDKLQQARFLAIIGSSGSGKSSLVKAGLIPQFLDSNRTGNQPWQVAFLNPEATPLTNLAQALHRTLSQRNRPFAADFTPETVEHALLNDPDILLDWLGQTRLLLIIDQFEELFRYQPVEGHHDDTARFIDLLLRFSGRPDAPVYIVLTMRSDYLDQCTDYDGLTDAINRGSYLLPKMIPTEIREAITAPVLTMGADITDALTERLLADIGNRPDQLPILQHALMRTWSHWQLTRTGTALPLDLPDYEAIGTMSRAISLHAETVFNDLPDDKSRQATEKLFKALVVLGPDNTSVVQPASVETISRVSGVSTYLLLDVVSRFREPGVAFLTPPLSSGNEASVVIDIAHERLITLWERLKTWVFEETESATFYRQLSQSAQLYSEGKSGLWVNPELQFGLKWLTESRPTQAWANRYDPLLERAVNFLTYSQSQHEFAVQSQEERQRTKLKRARLSALLLGIGTLISLLLVMVSAVLRTQARQSENKAIAEKTIALTERNRAEAQSREAITQQKIAEQQGILAEQQKRLTEEQREIAVREQRVADEKRREAETARQSAIAAQQRAEAARNDADRQRQQAEVARTEAERQKSLAESARKDAEAQRQRAVTAQQYSEQQRTKAVARALAIQSVQLTDNAQDDLPTLLALQAYSLNQKNADPADNPDIFNALAKAAQAQTVLRRHTDAVRVISTDPGGQTLATGSDDGTVKLWVLSNPTLPPVSLGLPRRAVDGIRSVVFGPDGQTVFGGSEKGMIYAWNPARPDAPVVSKIRTEPILALLFTANDALLSVSADGQLRTFMPTARGLDSLQHVRSGLPIYCARLSPDGKRLFCGSSNGRLLSFDPVNLSRSPEVFTRREFGNRVTALAFSPNGRGLVTGTSAGLVFAWQLTNYEPDALGMLLSGRHSSTVSDIAFSPSGQLLATSSADWSIHLWDYSSLTQQQQPIVVNDFDAWVMALRFTPDGKRLMAAGADKTVRFRTIDIAALYADLRRRAKRTLTPDEWNKYIGKDIPYAPVTPN